MECVRTGISDHMADSIEILDKISSNAIDILIPPVSSQAVWMGIFSYATRHYQSVGGMRWREDKKSY